MMLGSLDKIGPQNVSVILRVDHDISQSNVLPICESQSKASFSNTPVSSMADIGHGYHSLRTWACLV